jgi:branched-chain amino acid aminotransferase
VFARNVTTYAQLFICTVCDDTIGRMYPQNNNIVICLQSLCLLSVMTMMNCFTTFSLSLSKTITFPQSVHNTRRSTSSLDMAIGDANLDWQNLGFQFRETDFFVHSNYADGKWSDIVSSSNPYLPIHIGATALHYGQACFEGLKAFHNADGKVRVFRPQENAKRIAHSASRICMPQISEEMFLAAVKQVIELNSKFIPPYGTGGALYLRPLLFGSGPRIGLQPSDTYTFLILAIPVADYYRGDYLT